MYLCSFSLKLGLLGLNEINLFYSMTVFSFIVKHGEHKRRAWKKNLDIPGKYLKDGLQLYHYGRFSYSSLQTFQHFDHTKCENIYTVHLFSFQIIKDTILGVQDKNSSVKWYRHSLAVISEVKVEDWKKKTKTPK